MKINDIYESTTSGSVATVAMPMKGGVQSRSSTGTGIYPAKKGGNLLTGKKTSKPYANSVSEGKDKYVDLEPAITGLEREMNKAIDQGEREANDPEYRAKMIAARRRRAEQDARALKAAEHLDEEELIIVPGQGRNRMTGFIKHDPDKAEHEGETLKNSLHTIIRVATHLNKALSTSDNFPEWVSEKIGSIKSDMVSVMDYLISSQEMQGVREGKEAKNIAWATANKRGMLDNKNKK